LNEVKKNFAGTFLLIFSLLLVELKDFLTKVVYL